MTSALKPSRPWYRQGWPWFLIAIPAVSVVAGSITAWLAVSTSDGLVVDDYYKQGLAIHQTMERSQHALKLGLQAHMSVRADAVDLDLTARSAADVPDRVRLTFSHPTRAGMDQSLVLEGHRGHYTGSHKELVSGRWDVQIEDEARTWRLNGSVNLPAETEIRIIPAASQPVD